MSIERMGIEKGAVLILQRLLTRRFGSLPDWVGPRLAQASRQDLHTWADRLLDTEHPEGVFAAQGTPGPHALRTIADTRGHSAPGQSAVVSDWCRGQAA